MLGPVSQTSCIAVTEVVMAFSRKNFVQGKRTMMRIEEGLEGGTILVLKGHLLIEDLIRTKLEQDLPRPAHLVRANLGFFQVLCIFRCLFGQANGTDESLWGLIEAWNTLRNRLSHRLEPTDIQLFIRKILCLRPDWEYPLEHEETQAALSLTLGQILGYLDALRPLPLAQPALELLPDATPNAAGE